MESKPKVAIVTGASRGAGKGIALALGEHGCTVYVTGRSQSTGDHLHPGTIYETADRVTAAGGKGIAVRCDHADDADVQALFERVREEQGRLDILVNNAAAVHDELSAPGGFWEKPLRLGEMIDVGLKSGYVASWYGTPLMIDSGGGLIVFTSATGAVHYSMGPAYGAHKAGVDKMSFDMAVDFNEAGIPITSVSLWMGAVLTDGLKNIIAADPAKFAYLEGMCETPEFTGHVIWALANDPDRIRLTGQTLIGAELAVEYGVKDENDRQPPSFRDLHGVAPHVNYPLVIR